MNTTKIAIALIISACGSFTLFGANQKTFPTPDDAVKALVVALEAGNQDEIVAVLGDEAKEVVSSGDAIQDKANRENFLKSYKTKHALITTDENTRVLEVGAKNWDMPIPVVREDGKWRFDTAAGKQEILYRRIGENELGAIATCRGFIASQRDYAAGGHDGLSAGIYAQKLRSDAGKQNGLYWEVAEGEPESPSGPFLAKSTEEGYGKGDPYHGYYFRILTAQGAAAKGGAKSYLVDGQLKGGVALIARPAQYKNSGVMTFIINQNGVVYQKDLGDNTEDAAKAITEYNPDSTWKKVTP
jgi:Protein of unknown function (DUF2950)